MDQTNRRSRIDRVRDRSRRLFLQTVGAGGLGLTAGAIVASSDDDGTTESDDAEETDDGNDGDPTPIDSPTVIEEPGEYELVADLSPADLDERGCIVIDSEDVTLYGNGHTIDLSETATDRPWGLACIHVNRNPYGQRVRWATTIEDIEVRGAAIGITSEFQSHRDMTYTDVTAVDNGAGIRFFVSGGTLNNCVVEGNDAGVVLDGDTHQYGGSETTIEKTTVKSNAVGIDVREESIANVATSRVVTNGTGVEVRADAGTIEGRAVIERSHICNNERYGVDAGATPGPGEDAGPGEEPGPWVAEVDATDCYWGASDGPSSLVREHTIQESRYTERLVAPDEPFADPETGRLADGDGDAISPSLEPGVSNVRFDPFRDSPIEGVGADR